MTIAGNLRTMGVGDLVQWLATTKKTGTLVFDGTEFTKKLFFRQGDVVAVSSDNPREFLGHFLVGWGFCSAADVEAMILIQDENRLMLGEVAIKQGFLTEEDLHKVLTAKTCETLYDLILWDAGDFRFIESELPDRAFREIPLPVTSFLFEGHRQRDERRQMTDLVSGTDVVPILIAVPEDLTESDMALVMQMDGRGTIDELALANRRMVFDILKLVHRCVRSGLMQVHHSAKSSRLSEEIASPWKSTERSIIARLERGRFLDAFKMIQETLEANSSDKSVEAWAGSMMSRIEQSLDGDEIAGTDILELGIQLNDLVNLECDPAEGFVLSRITGAYSVDQVLRQLPGANLEKRIIIHNLIRRGLIKSRKATAVKPFDDSL